MEVDYHGVSPFAVSYNQLNEQLHFFCCLFPSTKLRGNWKGSVKLSCSEILSNVKEHLKWVKFLVLRLK